MNDSLINVWIITEKDGTINCAHCLGRKAGLAESCSHIASVLFYLEAWTKVNGKLSCTQMLCTWILPSFGKKVEYANASEINFKSANKMKADLNANIDRLHEVLQKPTHLSGKCARKSQVPALSKPEMDSLFCKLSKYHTKPVLLSLISPYTDSYVLPSCNIPIVMSLFDSAGTIGASQSKAVASTNCSLP